MVILYQEDGEPMVNTGEFHGMMWYIPSGND